MRPCACWTTWPWRSFGETGPTSVHGQALYGGDWMRILAVLLDHLKTLASTKLAKAADGEWSDAALTLLFATSVDRKMRRPQRSRPEVIPVLRALNHGDTRLLSWCRTSKERCLTSPSAPWGSCSHEPKHPGLRVLCARRVSVRVPEVILVPPVVDHKALTTEQRPPHEHFSTRGTCWVSQCPTNAGGGEDLRSEVPDE